MLKFNQLRKKSCQGFMLSNRMQDNVYEIALKLSKLDGTHETVKIYLSWNDTDVENKHKEKLNYCFDGVKTYGIHSNSSILDLLGSIDDMFNANVGFDIASILIQNRTFYFEKNELYKDENLISYPKDKMIFTQKLSLFALINLLSKNEYYMIKDSCGECLGTISHFSLSTPSISDLLYCSNKLSYTMNKIILKSNTQSLLNDIFVNNGETFQYGDKLIKNPLDIFHFLFESANFVKHMNVETQSLLELIPEIKIILLKIKEKRINEISKIDLKTLSDFNFSVAEIDEKINKCVTEVNQAS